jgi:uncharacterized protein (TIGR02301 family)
MQDLLNADTESEPKRRERLTAAFNRGYRSFAAVHTTCTDAARTAEERHRNEGATLAGEIAARFGIRVLFTSFASRPCRFGKRLLESLTTK